jgi:ferredoxin
VGGGPDDSTGSDVLVTPVEGGYVLEAVTKRGETLLDSPLLADAGDKSEEAASARERGRKSLGQAQDIGKASESLLAIFDDQGFWEDVAAKCLSCGACTYLCPTCYCFTLSDESNGLSGKRLRSWDTCMSFQFCLEASGHNPRPTKAHRLKNRVGHKFSYYPTLHDQITACCGCGRCIKSCPVSVDIREIVLKAIEHAKPKIQEVANG